MAQTGDLKNLFPPGNTGLTQGVGMIDGHDGKKYVFQTPQDNANQSLTIGTITFTLSENGKHIESVTQETPGGGTPR